MTMRRPSAWRTWALVFAMVAATPAVPWGWDCYGGWDPNQTCTSQASSCGSCGSCCTIIFDCNSARSGKFRHLAMTEYGAYQGHCLTDWCS